MKQFFTLLLVFAAFSLTAQVWVYEEFEALEMPDGWTVTSLSPDGGFLFDTPDEVSSSFCSFPSNGSTGIAASNDDGCGQSCNKSADYLIMPSFDVSGVTELYLSFDYSFAGDSYQGATESAYVEYSTDGGATWEVFEEIPGNGSGNYAWTPGFMDLSSLTGSSDLMVAFHYNDGGGWTYGLGLDNVFLYTSLPDWDAKLAVLPPNKYNLVGDGVDITVDINNRGGNEITSFDLVWSDGTNTYTENVTGVSIPSLGSYTHTHADQFMVDAAIKYSMEVWIENLDGNEDVNDGDNMDTADFQGVSTAPARKFVAEEATGTWCGWCPRGFVFMAYMKDNYPEDFVGIAVHGGDPMELNYYIGGLNPFFGGYPSVVVDRFIEVDPSQLEAAFTDASVKDRLVPAQVNSVSGTLDVASKELVMSGEAGFFSELADADYKLAFVLTEDGVTGTGSGYNQVNYYAGNVAGPMGGWEDLPDPVPAADMVYDEVAREIVPEFSGTNTGQDVVDGDNVSWDYTYDFPNGWAPNEMHLVLLVLDANTGEIMNSDKGQITVNCPSDLGVEMQVFDASGPGAEDGIIQVAPSVGISPFTIELDNGASGALMSGLAPGTYTLTVTDNAGCQDIQTVVVGPETSTNEISNMHRMTLTPNPTSGKAMVNVQFTEAVDVTVQLVNAMGQVIETAQQFGTQGQLFDFDLSKQASGVYFVKVTVADETRVERLMLTK